MNHRSNLSNLIKRIAYAVLLGIVVFGCASGKPTPAPHSQEEDYVNTTPWESSDEEIVNGAVVEDVVVEDPPVEVIPNEGDANLPHHPQKPSRPKKKYDVVEQDENLVEDIPAEGEDDLSPQRPSRPLKAEQFNAIIEVTKKIRLGASGTLNVWIGKKKYMPKQNAGTEIDFTDWYSYAGNYARITPVAKNFTIEPNEPTIVRIDETGSGAQYTITPKEKGKFEVSALIELFDNEECLGLPVVKPTQVLSVNVEVDYIDAIWTPVWSNFTRFWGAFVALFFGALLFVIRKFVKKKTGYSEGKDANPIQKSSEEENEGEEGDVPNEGWGEEQELTEDGDVPNEGWGEEQEPTEEGDVPNEGWNEKQWSN